MANLTNDLRDKLESLYSDAFSNNGEAIINEYGFVFTANDEHVYETLMDEGFPDDVDDIGIDGHFEAKSSISPEEWVDKFEEEVIEKSDYDSQAELENDINENSVIEHITTNIVEFVDIEVVLTTSLQDYQNEYPYKNLDYVEERLVDEFDTDEIRLIILNDEGYWNELVMAAEEEGIFGNISITNIRFNRSENEIAEQLINEEINNLEGYLKSDYHEDLVRYNLIDYDIIEE